MSDSWSKQWQLSFTAHQSMSNVGTMPRPCPYNPANVISTSERDGWTLGYIGIPWPGPWPKRSGDLFVTDPHGWQAGIAWENTGPEILRVTGASQESWGVFQVLFRIPVASEQDLVRNFHAVLPLLQDQRGKVQVEINLFPNSSAN